MTNEARTPTISDRMTGALLGMAIGDALGLVGESPLVKRPITGYEPVRDASGATIVETGQFSAHTEFALCLAESAISGGGFVDPVTAGYRFAQVLRSEHAHLVDPTSKAALERAIESGDFQAGLCDGEVVSAGPAARITPIALIHGMGNANPQLFIREIMRATLITHCDPLAVNGALAMAYALNRVVRRETDPTVLVPEVLGFIDEDAVARRLREIELLPEGDDAETIATGIAALNRDGSIADAVATAMYLFSRLGSAFEATVLAAAAAGPASAAIGAMAGALSGGWVGAREIPSRLVDGLDGRTYLLMAAPALYRTAQRRAGFYLQLHQRV